MISGKGELDGPGWMLGIKEDTRRYFEHIQQ